MEKARSSKRSEKGKRPSPLMVRLDEESKAFLAQAAELRRISVSDYVRTVTIAQARKEVLAAREQTADGTLEVQVNEVVAQLLDDAGGLGQDGRVGPADLTGPRSLGRRGGQQAEGPAVAPRHVDAIDALGADEGGAVAFHELTEGQAGVLLHRG